MSKSLIKAVNNYGGVAKYKALAYGKNNGCDECYYNNEDKERNQKYLMCAECTQDLNELNQLIKQGVL
jgi:hypothetical protein|tara:strand:- start:413 stop:616 length:204 start_codon:yes stop_codon:yes gene_type:complete